MLDELPDSDELAAESCKATDFDLVWGYHRLGERSTCCAIALRYDIQILEAVAMSYRHREIPTLRPYLLPAQRVLMEIRFGVGMRS